MIVHDDVLATGGTAKAKTELVEQLGGVVVGLLFVIELTFLNGRDKLDGYEVQSLIRLLTCTTKGGLQSRPARR